MTEQGKAINHAIETYSTGLRLALPDPAPLALGWGLGFHREGSKEGHGVKVFHNTHDPFEI